MSDITLNDDIAVLSGDLFQPRVGNWTSCLYLDTDTPPSGQCTISWLGKNYSGHVIHAGESETLTRVLIAGGVGNLYKTVKAKQYDQIYPVQVPLEEILSAVGEKLSPTCTPSVLSKPMRAWVRTEEDAATLLSLLADLVGAIWRVLPDGSIYFGEDSYPEGNDFDYTVLAENFDENYQELSVEAAGIAPGQSFLGRKVGAVLYRAYDAESRATVYFQDINSPNTDPIKAGLERIVKEIMRGEAYKLTYTGTVVNQSADGSLGIKIDDTTKIPYLSKVPVRVPSPGSQLKPKPGDRVQVHFERGEPTGYVTSLYEYGTGSKGVARVGDTVDVGKLIIKVVGMGAISGNYIPPGGVPPGIEFSIGTPINLQGKITSGSDDFLLR